MVLIMELCFNVINNCEQVSEPINIDEVVPVNLPMIVIN